MFTCEWSSAANPRRRASVFLSASEDQQKSESPLSVLKRPPQLTLLRRRYASHAADTNEATHTDENTMVSPQRGFALLGVCQRDRRFLQQCGFMEIPTRLSLLEEL